MAHPDWLHKKVREKEDKFRQQKLADMFNSLKRNDLSKRNDNDTGNHTTDKENVEDLEDFQNNKSSIRGPRPVVRCYEVTNNHNSVENLAQVGLQQADNGEQDNQVPKSLSSENIDRNVDYQGWLEMKKRKWKDTVNRRKKQRYYLAFRCLSSLQHLPCFGPFFFNERVCHLP